MHPASSIILFTTLSGLGYGLAAMLGLGLLDPALVSTKIAHVLAILLIAGGLLASTLHLGNPQRAWRALSQWRSSWLSREGVMAVATFMPLLASAWASVFHDMRLPITGLIGAAMCGVTVYCTAMIYASLRAIQAWNTPLTPACYLLFSLAGGLVLAASFATLGEGLSKWIALAGTVALAAAWGVKWAWWKRLRTMSPISTPASATGLGAIGTVRLFERPHVNENYLTREMGYKVARKHAAKLSLLATAAGGVLPCLFLSIAALSGTWMAATLCTLAVAGFALGMLVERWLFFAEARHAVMNYYGG
ncbi:dimethyl sulfoxide reductase anchor subunit family protein [Oryzicola mucosus]|uniref:Dimethyl sulfoxide reductase anchor subunit n=1 Tax=Oryzicola mucosus TaxID=2767425 RepID=A0A8J6U108_9HYPH|nr:DmsC/YnfH family molybdoenzyme membrane anchor subunit [Oryzicola mucosus]MBD0416411.1 dimethyl sulfoxide reductase anchor subunit [Oryzicola mucosus]